MAKKPQKGKPRGRSGGRAGGAGYDFQDLYIALQLAKLLVGGRDKPVEVLWEKKARSRLILANNGMGRYFTVSTTVTQPHTSGGRRAFSVRSLRFRILDFSYQWISTGCFLAMG